MKLLLTLEAKEQARDYAKGLIIVHFAPAAKSLSGRPEEACSRLEKLLIHFDAENCRKIIASQSDFKLP